MKVLNVIGNGFDIHCKKETSYASYMTWLKGKDPDLYNHILSVYYGNIFDEDLIPFYSEMDEDDPENVFVKDWWGRFEANLGEIDIREFAEYVRENAEEPDFGGDFHDSYWTDASVQAADQLLGINQKMKDSFREWVKSRPHGEKDDSIKFSTNDYFVTFNYTDTLQELYSVCSSAICYIHGRASAGDDLVLGHNKPESEFNAELKAARAMAREQYKQSLLERYDPHTDEDYSRIDEIIEEDAEESEDIIYYNIEGGLVEEILKLKKHPFENISKHKAFFDSVMDAEMLVFYWHSFESVDHDYFIYLLSGMTSLKKIKVYFYSPADRQSAESFFNINNRKGIEIEYENK